MSNIETLESRAYGKAFDRVKSWSNETLLAVYKAAQSRDACPGDGWGTYVNDSWVVITWDEWCEVLCSEIVYRKLALSNK